ncbi:carbohydrate ABC transporter permease [Streptomyces sp. NPDC060194]|uniref:carbohydrate ABC transporter permease n=1 Tax=Streptomyces sp. NPDC060194 TaxID=3347069 RepID=UPI00365F2274
MTAASALRARSLHPVRSALAVGLTYLSLLLGCAAVLLPLGVIVLGSLKTSREMANDGPLSPPDDWLNFDNFVIAFEDGKMLTGLLNTTFILFFSVIGTILIGSMTAYALDRFSFRLKRPVLGLFLFAALVPGVTTQVATYQIIQQLGAYNTPWAPILLYLGTDIISIYIFVQFMRSIPISLDEAARLEGANTFTIYWRIIMPLLRPAIATVVIIKGVFIYNDFYYPFLYMPSRDLGTISTSLFRFKGPFGAQWEVISAGAVLVIIPTLVVFLLLQRFIYRGLAAGAIK